MTAITQTYACTRCDGKGRINGFGHVLGGVCFKCKGSGRQRTRPSGPSTTWRVMVIDRESASAVGIYNIKARTATDAVRKARRHYERASAEFRTRYDMDAAYAMPATAGE